MSAPQDHPKRRGLKKAARTTAKKTEKPIGPDPVTIDIRTRKTDLQGKLERLKRKLPPIESSTMPRDLAPMLASTAPGPFTDDDWQFEVKLDGYRCLAYVKNGSVELRSRNNLSFNRKFAPVHEALLNWDLSLVVDGEVVVLNEDGVPDFSGIQQWEKRKEGQLVYYVFDLLWVEGTNLMEQPLHLRVPCLRNWCRKVASSGSVIISTEWAKPSSISPVKTALKEL
jgi:bifunctional non-homologous end joining protein LigD